MRPQTRRALLPLVAGALAASAAAHATTVVPMSARDLVASSIGAVRGQVTRIDTGADAESGAIYTYVSIEPTQLLFGSLPSGTLVLREIGGRVGDREQWIFGSPEYQVGESVLVFLSRHRDGALRTTALSLGKYRLEEHAGGARAVRHFGADVAVLDPQTGVLRHGAADETVAVPKLLARVRTALAAGVGAAAAAPALSHPPEMRRVALVPSAAFTLLNPAVRRFEADAGTPIGYVVDTTGDATIGPQASRAAVDSAMAVWSAVPNAFIELQDVGDAEPAPLGGCPDENRIVFNDPFGEVDAPTKHCSVHMSQTCLGNTDCPSGETCVPSCEGILGITLVCDSDEQQTINGRTYRRILNAKVTFNDGFGDCSYWTACNLAQIATHELGHTVGLGHSQFPSATMAERAVFDGRCAGLTLDDEAALRYVYPLPATPTPTPTTTPSPAPTSTSTRTGTVTRTPSRTATSTSTTRPTRTQTVTLSRTATRTPTPPATPTATRRGSASATGSATRSPTASSTPSAPSTTAAASPTPTATPSQTPTPTLPPRPGDWLTLLVGAVRRLLAMIAARLLAR